MYRHPNSFTPAEILPLTFQEYSVNQWLGGGVPASKLIVGIPLYGRTYILADPEDHGLGAPINGSGTAGPHTKEPGFLSYYEVFQSVSTYSNSLLKVHKLNNQEVLQCIHGVRYRKHLHHINCFQILLGQLATRV